MAQALAGIRVLDLTRILAGPSCTQLLGDLGADVIKIERPGAGDDTRKWGPPYVQGPDGPTAESAYYLCANRNKRSVAVDIATEAGQALIRRLLARCDVLVENFKVGDLARYGLGWEQLRGEFPWLVYCSITGFGQTGPYAPRAGYDYLAQGAGRHHEPHRRARRAADEGGRGHRRHHVRHVRCSRDPGGPASPRRHRPGPGHRRRPARHADCLAGQRGHQLPAVGPGAAPPGHRAPQHRSLQDVRQCGRLRHPGGRQRCAVPEMVPLRRCRRARGGPALRHQQPAGGQPAGAVCADAGVHARQDHGGVGRGPRGPRRALRASEYPGSGVRRPAGAGARHAAGPAAPQRRGRARSRWSPTRSR